jgi:hypothetical protein
MRGQQRRWQQGLEHQRGGARRTNVDVERGRQRRARLEL